MNIKNWVYLPGGIRVLSLIHRKPTLTTEPLLPVKSVIVSRSEFIPEAINELKQLIASTNQRIYCTANTRNFEKADRYFRQQLFEWGYQDAEQRFSFNRNIHYKWVSSLCQLGCRKSKNYLFDIDDESHYILHSELLKHTSILGEYKTRKGSHIITEPFDVKKLNTYSATLHRDGMIPLFWWDGTKWVSNPIKI